MSANLDRVQATRHQTAQPAEILHPGEGFLDHFSTTQTDPVALGGLDVLGHGAVMGLARHFGWNPRAVRASTNSAVS